MSHGDKKVKYSNEKPGECKFCYFWGGRNKGCEYIGDKPCYYILEEKVVDPDSCEACPYGKQRKCLGYCTKKLLAENKEKVKAKDKTKENAKSLAEIIAENKKSKSKDEELEH